MNVMNAARSIGLANDQGRDVFGTIAEDVVLAALSELGAAMPGNDDLVADAAMRVQLARSAGVVTPEQGSIFGLQRRGDPVQLRYRSDMADVFVDLAIDVGLRDAARLADSVP